MIIIPLAVLGIFIVIAAIIIVRIFFRPKRVKNISQLYKQGKYAQASRMAKQILARDNRNADAHYFLGLCYEAEGKSELALMELKTVNQLSKFDEFINELEFRKKIAELFLKFNQSEEALKEYLLLVKKDENNAEYYFLIGSLFEQRNRPDKAVNYYKKAINLDERHAGSHAQLGSLLYRAKRFSDARGYLERAVKLDPENTQGSYFLGKIFKDNNDYHAALNYFERSSKDPELKVKSLAERGACYINMGDVDRAQAELRRAIKIAKNPRSQEVLYARYLLAYILEKERKIEEAIEHWEEIYKVKEDFRDISEKLANYQDLRTDDTIKDFLIAGQEEFLDMCKKAAGTMSFVVHEITPINGGCQILASENTDKKWRNQRKQPRLMHFLRVTDPIDESTIRSFNDTMREQNFPRGVILTSSTFSKMAQNFAESRPIELFDKDKLQKILKTALSS
ncbi:tetratricopeptide repeat protein [Salinispira pacifica]|uniref:TPR domain protein n=1 Tax=Salinispira pacifica TaxID=1307761 RepID=V5WHF5_9SPIO|nr:tetratricopeptide repeat protein [Salinispira pacifica]AHC15030.1 TPR domain protein [Salinispira pacifica]